MKKIALLLSGVILAGSQDVILFPEIRPLQAMIHSAAFFLQRSTMFYSRVLK